MFENFPQAIIDVVSPDGSLRHQTKAVMDAKSITIADTNVMILVGDEIRRKLPNGIEEAFEVMDPIFCDQFHSIPAHYQIKVRRKGTFPQGKGGNYHVNLSGPNARVNISSNDNSHNFVGNTDVFKDLALALSHISDLDQKDRLERLMEGMQKSQHDRPRFLEAYQRFVASAASHMTIVAPFLPALTNMLS